MKYNNDFETRLLYDQSCKTEEGMNVFTSMYAALWTYPGAMTKTTARIRLSCVYSYEGNSFHVIAATIEKWRNEGWSLLDDYHDTRRHHNDVLEVRDRLLNQAKSFLMGIPLEKIDDDYNPDDPHSEEAADDIKPVLSIVEFKKEKGTNSDIISKSNAKNKSSDETDDDDDDFDFI